MSANEPLPYVVPLDFYWPIGLNAIARMSLSLSVLAAVVPLLIAVDLSVGEPWPGVRMTTTTFGCPRVLYLRGWSAMFGALSILSSVLAQFAPLREAIPRRSLANCLLLRREEW